MVNNTNLSRRTTMKAICGAIGGGALIGNAQGRKYENVSVSEFEDYCEKVSEEHGGRTQKIEAAARNESGEIKELGDNINSDNVSKLDSEHISYLNNGEARLASVEVIEYEDGKRLKQVVNDTGEGTIKVLFGDKRFKLKKDDVESVLDSRLERSKTKLRRKEKTNPSPHSDRQVERRDKVSRLSGGYEVTETEFANVDSDSDNPWWIPGGRTSTDTNVDDSAYGGRGQTDRVEARCRSSAAGVVSCYSQGYDRWTSIENEVSVEYEGDYVADVGNLFGSSELTMRLYIKDADFNLIRNSPALQHSSSIAGIRGYDDNYDQGLYISDYADDEVYIGMKVYCGAVAVGSSTATINALTDPDNPTPGHFGLDNFYLKTE